MSGRQAIWGAVAFLGLLLGPEPARAQNLEYQIKANYLVRFAAFVEWPASAFTSPAAPLTLCLAGRDPFGRVIDQAAAAQTAHGRRIVVRRLTERMDAAGCHIAYRGAGADPIPSAPGLLVVSDSAVAPDRGAIHFVIVSNRVRFRIDQAAAQQARLNISSRLLNLAVDVRGSS